MKPPSPNSHIGPSSGRLLVTFEEAAANCAHLLKGPRRAIVGCCLLPAGTLAMGVGIRLALGINEISVAALVVTGTWLAVWLSEFIAEAVKGGGVGPFRRVDWATGADQERRLLNGLGVESFAVLCSAAEALRIRSKAPRVHLCRMTCACGKAPCVCLVSVRMGAGVRASRRHPVLLAGDLLLDRPMALEAVLTRELAHVTRGLAVIRKARLALMMFAWPPLGLLTPRVWLPIAAPALWCVLIGISWAEEITCDVVAAYRHPAGSLAYFHELRELDPAGWWRWLGQATFLTQPPLVIRFAFVRLAVRLTDI